MFRSRRELRYYEPTKAWLASREPQTKKEILVWYKRAKTELGRRRQGSILRTFSAYTILVDAETKQPKKKSKKPTDYELDIWRLSEQDYQVFLGSLERQFQQLKDKHNERVRAKKQAAKLTREREDA